MNKRFRPARRPPAIRRVEMAGGFAMNPQPLNPEPVNGYKKIGIPEMKFALNESTEGVGKDTQVVRFPHVTVA